MRRVFAVCAAAVLVLPTQAAGATTVGRALPARNLTAFENRGPVHLLWTDPAGTDRVLGRYSPGRTAPTTPAQGRPMGLARTAHGATLRDLRPATVYSVAIWTKHAGVLSRPTTITFTTKPAPRPPTPVAEASITGLVTDSAGHPLRNARIGAYGRSGLHNTVTDIEGRFSLRGRAGTYYLSADGTNATGGDADATGYQSKLRVVHVAPNTTRTANFTLVAGGAVHGVLTDAAGHPVPGIAVTWQPPQPYLEAASSFSTAVFLGIGSTHTNRSGGYTLKGLGAAGVVPCFEPSAGYAARCAPEAAAAAPRQTVTVPTLALTAAPSGTIYGTVSAVSGHRLDQVFVDAEQPGGGFGPGVEPRHGRFTLSGLKPGRWRVCATAVSSDNFGVLPSCVVRTVTADHRTPAMLRLRTGGAISGRVLGPSGRGVAVPSVIVNAVRRHTNTDGATTIVADRRGFYTVGGLPTGDYRVCLSGDNSPTAPGDPTGVAGHCLARVVHVVAGRDRIGVDATLPVGGAAAGRITDSAGHPVVGADVAFVRFGNGSSFELTTTGADGRYRVADMTPGRWAMCAVVLRGRYGSLQHGCLHHPITTTAGHTLRGVDLRFPAQTVIRVRVTDASGHPLSGVEVAALRPCSDPYQCPPQPVFGPRNVAVDSVSMTDAHGTGIIDTSRAGHFAVCALGYYGATPAGTSPTGYADKCSGSTFDVVATPGAPGAVTLALDPGGVVTGRVTNAQGRGVRNAQLHVTGSPVDDVAPLFDPFLFGGISDVFPSPFRDNRTDATGRYTIRSVRPGQARVCAAQARGYADRCLPTDVTVSASVVTTAPNLVLQPGRAAARAVHRASASRPTWQVTVIDGRVVDGRPIRPNSAGTGRFIAPN